MLWKSKKCFYKKKQKKCFFFLFGRNFRNIGYARKNLRKEERKVMLKNTKNNSTKLTPGYDWVEFYIDFVHILLSAFMLGYIIGKKKRKKEDWKNWKKRRGWQLLISGNEREARTDKSLFFMPADTFPECPQAFVFSCVFSARPAPTKNVKKNVKKIFYFAY